MNLVKIFHSHEFVMTDVNTKETGMGVGAATVGCARDEDEFIGEETGFSYV